MPIVSEKEKQQKLQEKFQAILSGMLREEDNKYCVDCDAKGPRWASWNLGVFLCIRCAGIHRNLGVHISRVKSVNLDQWTAEQIASMQAMGNSKARAVYEANLPENFRRSQTDSAMEQFIRSKYEQKKWIAKEWVPQSVTVTPDLIDNDSREKRKSSAKTESKVSAPANLVKQSPSSNTSLATKKNNSSKSSNESSNEHKLNTNSSANSPPLIDVSFDSPITTKTSNNTVSSTNTTNNSTLDDDLFKNFNESVITNEFNQNFPSLKPAETKLEDDLSKILIGDTNIVNNTNSQAKFDKNSILKLYNNNTTNATANNIAASLNPQFQFNQMQQKFPPTQFNMNVNPNQNVNFNPMQTPSANNMIPSMVGNYQMGFATTPVNPINTFQAQGLPQLFTDQFQQQSKLPQQNNQPFQSLIGDANQLFSQGNIHSTFGVSQTQQFNHPQTNQNLFDFSNPIRPTTNSNLPNIGNTLTSNLWQ